MSTSGSTQELSGPSDQTNGSKEDTSSITPTDQPTTDELLSQIHAFLVANPSELSFLQPKAPLDDPAFPAAQPPHLIRLIWTHLFDPARLHPQAERCIIYALISEYNRVEHIKLSSRPRFFGPASPSMTEMLSTALVMGAMSVILLPRKHPDRGMIIRGYGRALRCRWHVTRTRAHLDDAIRFFRAAVDIEVEGRKANELCPDNDLHTETETDVSPSKDHALQLEDLACTSTREADFNDACEAFEKASTLDHCGTPLYLSNLGLIMQERLGLVQDLPAEDRNSILDQSIGAHVRAINSVTNTFSHPISVLHKNMALAYFARFSDTMSSADPIHSMDSNIRRLVTETSDDGRGVFFRELGRLYNEQFTRLGSPIDGERAKLLLHAALRESPGNRETLVLLGNVLKQSGVFGDSQRVLTEAVDVLEAVVAETPENDANWIEWQRQLSEALSERFELKGSSEDLDKAIQILETVLGSPLLPQSDRWDCLRRISTRHLLRYEFSQKRSELDNATRYIRSALACINLPDSHKAACLREYGKILYRQHILDGTPALLQETIDSYAQAISLCGADPVVSHYHNDMGNALTHRFGTTGSREDATKATACFTEAIECLDRFPSPTAPRDKPMFLYGLANIHLLQFERWRQLPSIDIAIRCYKEVVDSTSDTDSRRCTRLGGLSWALQEKFDITHDLKLLKAAEEYLVTALSQTDPPLLPTQIVFLHTRLGAVHLRRWSENKDMVDLDKAETHYRTAMTSGCTDPSQVDAAAINLFSTLMHKYEATKDQKIFHDCGSQMLKFTAQNLNKLNPYSMRVLFYNMGNTFTMYYDDNERFQPGAKLSSRIAIESYTTVFQNSASEPYFRVHAAAQVARLTFEASNDAAKSIDVLETAIKLLPEAVMVGPQRADQLRLAKTFWNIPTISISISLSAGRSPASTLQLFERARCIIWDRLIDQRSELSNLEQQYPELATSFDEIRVRLSRDSVTRNLALETLSRNRLDHLANAAQYHELLTTIRQKPGFDNFLILPQTIQRLEDFAIDGPIVVLSNSRYRSDAIIIKHDGVIQLSLPLLTHESCISNLVHLLDAITSKDQAKSLVLLDSVLKWLWEVAACPVLDKLNFTGCIGEGEELPRIWWMTSGWVGMFPIHAAGDHQKALQTGEPCSVIDRVISSYTPTLKALEFSRQSAATKKKASNSREEFSAMLVQMPTTPDREPLDNVVLEVSAVGQVLEAASVQTTTLDLPTRKEVVSKLKTCTAAHFACHGSADQKDPSASLILLQDWHRAPFDVRSLMRTPMPNCQFVYLSACETAVVRDIQLKEEAIHISAAFQLAGVPHVVATLWRIDDTLSVDLARDFYQNLSKGLDDMKTEDHFADTAKALHGATVKARADGVNAFFWGAFVHSGK